MLAYSNILRRNTYPRPASIDRFDIRYPPQYTPYRTILRGEMARQETERMGGRWASFIVSRSLNNIEYGGKLKVDENEQ